VMLLLLPLATLLLAGSLPAPCLKWRHPVDPVAPGAEQPQPVVRGSIGIIETASGLQEVVALLGNGTLLSYSISISGAVGPSVDLGGAAAAPPVVLGTVAGLGTTAAASRGACPAASSELVAVLIGVLPEQPCALCCTAESLCGPALTALTALCVATSRWQRDGCQRCQHGEVLVNTSASEQGRCGRRSIPVGPCARAPWRFGRCPATDAIEWGARRRTGCSTRVGRRIACPGRARTVAHDRAECAAATWCSLAAVRSGLARGRDACRG
jgi:hypothetical protein